MALGADTLVPVKDTTENVCVVRLRTTVWSDKKGIYTKKSLTFLRRYCKGYNMLEEEADIAGAENVFPQILNLLTCADGLYEVRTCNLSRDYETGYVDDYDFELVPFNAG